MNLARWYPLRKGRTMVYRYEDPELPGPSKLGVASRSCLAARRLVGGLAGVVEERIESGGKPWVRSFEVRIGVFGIREWDRLVLKEPLDPATRWEDGPDAFRIASLTETVTVPGGRFEGCLLVTYYSEDIGGGSLWFAPGTGLVRSEQYGERGPHLYELTRVVGP